LSDPFLFVWINDELIPVLRIGVVIVVEPLEPEFEVVLGQALGLEEVFELLEVVLVDGEDLVLGQAGCLVSHDLHRELHLADREDHPVVALEVVAVEHDHAAVAALHEALLLVDLELADGHPVHGYQLLNLSYVLYRQFLQFVCNFKLLGSLLVHIDQTQQILVIIVFNGSILCFFNRV